MRPYRDAFKFSMKFLGALFLTGFLCNQFSPALPGHVIGLIMIFSTLNVMYFVLIRLLKRYIAFYCDIAAIRAEVKMPYGEVKTPYSD